MKYIAVFCSSRDLDEKYINPAKEFSRLLVEHGYYLVFGGSDTGLMKVVADEVQKNGGKVLGVSMQVFHHLAMKNADEMILAKDLGDRKAIMLDRAVAIVALVGGLGTLDELVHITELKRQKHHEKPIVVLDTDNFYEGLKIQFERMEKDGFNQFDIREYIKFIETPKEAIEFINKKLSK
mgnify:FL=1